MKERKVKYVIDRLRNSREKKKNRVVRGQSKMRKLRN